MKLDQLAGIRGIAAWWVVLFHSVALMDSSLPPVIRQVFEQGYLAVDLFFVLSGFVIYLNYHAALEGGPRSYGLFYWKRWTRIYPLHVVMLLGYLFLYGAFRFLSSTRTAPSAYTMEAFLQSLFLVQTWVGADLTWNVPAWSISAEWFVYLLFPALACGVRAVRRQVGLHLLAAVLLAMLLHLLYTLQGLDSLGKGVARMALVRTLLEFLMGVLVASLYVHHRSRLLQWRGAAYAGFLILCAACTGGVANHAVIPAAFTLLIAALCVDTSPIRTALAHPALVYLGEISYSTYMVHYLIYDLFKAALLPPSGHANQILLWLSFVVVLLLSVLLHHLIDMPAQNYFRKLSMRSAAALGKP